MSPIVPIEIKSSASSPVFSNFLRYELQAVNYVQLKDFSLEHHLAPLTLSTFSHHLMITAAGTHYSSHKKQRQTLLEPYINCGE